MWLTCRSFWLVLWLPACTAAPSAPAPVPLHARTEQRAPPVRASLWPADAEVWAWSIHVSGELAGPGQLASCVVRTGAAAFAAKVEGRHFVAKVSLNEGSNRVQARCSDSGGAMLQSVPARYVVRLHDAPVAHARARVQAHALVLDASTSTPSEHSAAPLIAYQWFVLDGEWPAQTLTALGETARVVLPVPDGDAERSYELHIRDARGRSDTARVTLTPRAGALHIRQLDEGPSWLPRAIVYGIYPPLYGVHPLEGVIAALDGLADLGVTVLWLSPIMPSPPGDFGYAVTDYFSVRTAYGTKQDLQDLVDQAHQRGLRVLLDLVPNHSSDQHRYFVQARQLGAHSYDFGFYERDAAGQAVHYFDWEMLPNFAYDLPDMRRFMRAVSRYWLRELQVDGYRMDAAWGVRARRPSFWPGLSAELRRMRPDVMLIAEGSARDPFYLTNGFDVAYDWTDAPGQWAWQHVFDSAKGIVLRLQAAVAASGAAGDPRRVLRFLDNNDTGARFITRHGLAMTRVATTALFTLPGVPCLYSFGEVGAEFLPYDAPHPLEPPARPELRAFHKRLIALRRALPALAAGALRELTIDAAHELYAFLRYLPDGSAEPVLIVLHFAAEPVRARITLPADLVPPGTQLRDALSGKRIASAHGVLSIALPGWAVRVAVAVRPAIRRRAR